MNAPIERIDRPTDIRPGEIIKKVDRSAKEKDQNGFSKALKEKLEEELGKKKGRRKDVLEIGDESDKQNMEAKQEQQSADDPGPDESVVDESDDREKDPEQDGSSGHVDLKA